jgi:UDP-N-acetylglucosamine 1-carboxyvinyltransferase
MTNILIKGGQKLNGHIQVSGSKNSATKVLIACILTKDICILENVPQISDVDSTLDILIHLGVNVKKLHNNKVIIQANNLSKNYIPKNLAELNRISFMFIGSLLNRFNEVYAPLPGGCNIGKRPINYHLDFLKSFEVEVTQINGYFHAKCVRLKGNKIKLPFPSTTTTEHILLCSVLADGITVIENACQTPETLELVEVLQKMGANIERYNN